MKTAQKSKRMKKIYETLFYLLALFMKQALLNCMSPCILSSYQTIGQRDRYGLVVMTSGWELEGCDSTLIPSINN